MNSYFSTFITGFGEVVEEHLVKSLKDVEILLLVDGLVIYKTSSSLGDIKELKFLNNSFILLKKVGKVYESSVKEMCKALIHDRNVGEVIESNFSQKKYKFRVRASVKNQFVAIDKNVLRNVEERIAQLSENLELDRSLPDIEFLIAIRSEGFGLLGIQFTRRSNYEKTLEKGELYPELAYILCLISDPDKSDVFMDPMAGHGSIPGQRINFPYKKIIAGEVDISLQKKLKTKFGEKVLVELLDATQLNGFTDGSIDKIVTDPPWGLHDMEKDIPDFYFRIFQEFCRVLKGNGMAVVLTSQKEVIEDLFLKFVGRLELVKKYTTLVSGKKVGVYKLKKTS